MKIIDPSALAEARARPFCEWCHRPNRGDLQAAHIYGKGMGGGFQCDHPLNLVALCLWCHDDNHHGREPIRCDLLAVVAAREGKQQAEIEDALLRMRWGRKAQ